MRKNVIIIISVLFLAIFLCGTVSAADNETNIVSVNSSGIQGNSDVSGTLDISDDGRYVAFCSYATNLVDGDTNGYPDIFVHDSVTGETSIVSVKSDGTQGNGASISPSISGDGRYVAFSSWANNLFNGYDSNNQMDIFVHDRNTHETTLVSKSTWNDLANGQSAQPEISSNGRYVTYMSLATNLADLYDYNNQWDIFVYDIQTGETSIVSVNPSYGPGDYSSYSPSISADGRYVSFESGSRDLVDDDTNGFYDIFVRDRLNSQTTRISVDSFGNQANGASSSSSISADGRYVTFTSSADNLVWDDTNGYADIFVHDRTTGETIRVNVNFFGYQADSGSTDPVISGNGRIISFQSYATNLVDGTYGYYSRVYSHDMHTMQTILVSVDTNGNPANGDSGGPAISYNGNHIAFGSNANNLVSSDLNGYTDAFVRSTVVNVFPGDSIQLVIDNVSENEQIILQDDNGNPVTYEADVVVNKKVTIKADGDVTVQSTTPGTPAFTVLEGGDGSTLEGFDIIAHSPGIFLENVADIVITGMNINSDPNNSNWTGIYLLNCFNITIINNNITLNTTNSTGNWTGILLVNSTSCTIQNNNVTGSQLNPDWCGIKLENNSNNNTLLENNITSCSTGLNLNDSYNSNITDNHISGNNAGILIDNAQATVDNNTIENHIADGINVMNSSGNIITNNHITNSGTADASVAAITLYQSTDNQVRGNTIVEGGINLYGTENPTSGNIIEDNEISGHIYGPGDTLGTGIKLYEADNNNLNNNTIHNNQGPGIYLEYCNGNILENNTLTDNNVGIHLIQSNGTQINSNIISGNGLGGIYIDQSGSESSPNLLSGNTLTNNGIASITSSYNLFLNNSITNDGFYFSNSNYNTVIDNEVSNITFAPGINLLGSSNNKITGNNVCKSQTGINLMMGSDQNAVYGNIIENNDNGVNIESGNYNNLFYNNNFVGNTVQASVGNSGDGNSFNKTEWVGGNYWSDYNGVDRGEGFGNTPYTFTGGQDNLPYVRQIWNVFPGDSIQTAINNAMAGDNIVVHDDNGNSFIYGENLTVNKLLIIKSDGNVTVHTPDPLQPIFTINSLGSGSTIQGFTISGAISSNGVYIDSVSDCIFLNLSIENCSIGVYSTGTNTNVTLQDLIINGTFSRGVYASGTLNNFIFRNVMVDKPSSDAIDLYGLVNGLRMDNVTINQGGDNGIRLDYGSGEDIEIKNVKINYTMESGIALVSNLVYKNVLISDNTLIGTNNAIWINAWGSGPFENFTIRNNQISNNRANGMNFNNNGVVNATVTNNTVANNSGSGIVFRGQGNVNITNNTIKSNNWGMEVRGINNPSINISGNTVDDNINGIAIYTSPADIHFNRIVGSATLLYNDGVGFVNAENNWWGSNANPSANITGSNLDYDPWLVMNITANPTTVPVLGTSNLTANFTLNSNGVDTSSDGHLPDGTPVRFTTDIGNLGSKTVDKNTVNGVATVVLTADTESGTAHISGQTDNQTVNTSVNINSSDTLTWIDLNATGSKVEGPAYAYDTDRNVAVVFGGYDESGVVRSETWEWDGTQWTQINVTGPGARVNSQMAYDALHKEIVMYGGWTKPDNYYGDTWTYNGTSWELKSTSGPGAQANGAMAYDSTRQVVVLYINGATWEWNGTTWTYVTSSGPGSRILPRMAYYENTNRTVLFGGKSGFYGSLLGDTWEWDGSSWTQVASTGPDPRDETMMAYNPDTGKIVLYGGGSWGSNLRFNDTWEWDGASWSLLNVTGPLAIDNGLMFFDELNRYIVISSGKTSDSVPQNSTYSLSYAVGTGNVVNSRTLESFDTIQAAIDDFDTLDGDTITAYATNFLENINVWKRLVITANGIVQVQPLNINRPVFTITSTGSGSTIQGFTLTNSTSSSGVLLESIINCTLTNLTIFNCSMGVHFTGTNTNITLQNINITSPTSHGIYFTGTNSFINLQNISVSDAAGHGIFKDWYSNMNDLNMSYITITNTLTANWGTGIAIANNYELSNVSVDHVTVTGAKDHGLSIENASGTITVQNCVLTGNAFARGDNVYYGLHIIGSNNPTVILNNNTINGNRNGIDIHGIQGNETNPLIFDNFGSDNGGYSVYLENVNYVTVRNNTFNPTNNYLTAVYLTGTNSNITLENLTINNPSDIGVNKAPGSGITGLTFKNVTINGTLTSEHGSGIALHYGTTCDVLLDHVTITGARDYGIWTEGISGLFTLINSNISNNGIYGGDSRFYGLHLVGSGNPTVNLFNNTINGNQNGVYFENVNSGVLSGNTILNNIGDGINLDNTQGTIISEGNVSNNGGNGIYIINSSNIQIYSLNLEENSENGIYIDSSNQVSIFNTLVNGNGVHGISLWGSNDNNITNNNITGNGVNSEGNGINIAGDDSQGIQSNSNQIINNSVENNINNGINLSNAHNNNLSGNDFTTNGDHGISIWCSNSNNVTDNNVTGNGVNGDWANGINIDADESQGLQCYGNQVNGNVVEGNANIGINVADAQYSDIINNTVTSNGGHGIGLWCSNDNNITTNNVTGNGVNGDWGTGINIDADESQGLQSCGNQIIGNIVENNTKTGINVVDAEYNNISNNIINGNGAHGISLGCANDNNITYNNITNNGGTEQWTNGINIDGDYSQGLQSNGNLIMGNLIQNNFFIGINMGNANDNTIINNTVDNNANIGISIHHYSENNELWYNNITNNGEYGISLNTAANNNIIEQNQITSNGFDNEWGCGIVIYLVEDQPCVGNDIGYNIITGNRNGVSLNSCQSNMVVFNNITSNGGYGINLWCSSYNFIVGNEIMFNGYSSDWANGINIAGDESQDLYSDGNQILMNTIQGNRNHGIWMSYANNNTLMGNTLDANSPYLEVIPALCLDNANNNTIDSNIINNHTNDNGIALGNSSDNHIINNQISNSYGGINVYYNSNHNYISGNIINDDGAVGILLGDNSQTRGNNITNNYLSGHYSNIEIRNSLETTINNNIITNTNNGGLSVQNSPGIIISNNQMNNVGYSGIGIYQSPGSSITNNTVNNTSGGINLYLCTGTNIINNTINGIELYGLDIGDSPYCNVSGNNITNVGDVDLSIYNSPECTFSNNHITNNQIKTHTINVEFWSETQGDISGYRQYMDITNTVNGKPVHYIMDVSGLVIDQSWNVGFLALVNCTNVNVTGINMNNTGMGIFLVGTNNTRIGGILTEESCNFTNNAIGVRLIECSEVQVINNLIKDNWQGIQIRSDTGRGNNTLIGNIVANNQEGISIESSPYNTMTGNNITSNTTNALNFGVTGGEISQFRQYIDITNTINGNPIQYILDASNLDIDETWNPGYLALVNCTNINVTGVNITNNVQGLLLAGTNNTIIGGTQAGDVCSFSYNREGIFLFRSSYNQLLCNQISHNINEEMRTGINMALNCDHNLVKYNNITENGEIGIEISSSSYNQVEDNILDQNGILVDGVSEYYIFGTVNNIIARNTITNSSWSGITVQHSYYNQLLNNTLSGNCNITDDYVYWIAAIEISASNNTMVSGNQIINNYLNGIHIWDGWGYMEEPPQPSENNQIISNNISGNEVGILVRSDSSTNIIQFNRIVGNTECQLTYTGGENILNATNNWWGSNSEPTTGEGGMIGGMVNHSTWLYMNFTVVPERILNGATSELTTSFNYICDGTTVMPIDPASGHLADGCPVTFTTDLGSVGSLITTKFTSNGLAIAILTANEGNGIANVSTQIDNQTFSYSVLITDIVYVNGDVGNDLWDGTSPFYISGNEGPKKTIQNAVNALVNGGTINVATGTYSENLVLDRKIALFGAGIASTILSPASVGSNVVLVNIGGQGSTISGFNITGATGVAAIMLNNVNDTLIHNNTIMGNTIGIAFNSAGNNTVYDVSLINNGAAVQIYRSNLNTVNNCTFTSNDYGVYLLEANNNNVSNSLFTVTNGNGRALYLESGQGNQINCNTITGGVYGIESLNDYQNIYDGNDISGTAWRNIYLTNPQQDTITGNRIHDTINGLLLLGGSQNQIVGNTLFGCGSGLEVVNSFNNLLNDNNITQNTFGMYIYGNTGTTISQNNVTNCGSAIELHDSSENTVNSNNLAMNTFGVYIAGGSLNAVEGNIVFNTLYGGAGVHFENTSNSTINNNSFTSDVKDFRYGIYINEGSNNAILNNNASNNHAGLELHNTDLNQVTGNNLNTNTVGLFMDNVSGNVFTSNVVVGNGAGVEMHDSHLNTFNGLFVAGSTFGFIIFNGNNNTITSSTLNSNGAAINLQTCINTTIDNNQMNNNSYGVYILNGDHNLVQNSQITDIKLDGSGVFLDNTTQNTVKENSFINTVKLFTYGIYQNSGSNNTLESNTAIRNHAGIELHDATGNLIKSNDLSYNTLGVFIWASSQNNLTFNVINNNGAGIEIHQSTANNLTGNNLTSNVYGMYLDQLTSSNIKTNNFTSNTIGLFSDNANSNEIFTNNFDTNDTQAYDTGTNNWDNGVNTGNYWSDYSGVGTYPIPGGSNVDHYPKTTPF